VDAGLVDGAYPHLRQIVVTHGRLPTSDRVETMAGDVRARVAALKREPGRDVWLCGGGDLAAQLIEEIDEIEASFKDGTADPYKMKRALARNICDLYHGAGAGDAAEAAFDAQFKRAEIPEDVPEFPLSDVTPNDQGLVYLAKLMVDTGLAKTVGEARRFIDGGGVKIDGTSVAAKSYNIDPSLLTSGVVIQHGKRKFARLV
jgi:tyrosyl-tRNA synthetase